MSSEGATTEMPSSDATTGMFSGNTTTAMSSEDATTGMLLEDAVSGSLESDSNIVVLSDGWSCTKCLNDWRRAPRCDAATHFPDHHRVIEETGLLRRTVSEDGTTSQITGTSKLSDTKLKKLLGADKGERAHYELREASAVTDVQSKGPKSPKQKGRLFQS